MNFGPSFAMGFNQPIKRNWEWYIPLKHLEMPSFSSQLIYMLKLNHWRTICSLFFFPHFKCFHIWKLTPWFLVSQQSQPISKWAWIYTKFSPLTGSHTARSPSCLQDYKPLSSVKNTLPYIFALRHGLHINYSDSTICQKWWIEFKLNKILA